MSAAARNSSYVWGATKWVTSFLGVSAATTFGLELTGEREISAFVYIVIAGLCAAMGGVLNALNTAVAKSQMRRSREIAPIERRVRLGRFATTGLLGAQIIALAVLILAQIGALRIALTPDEEPSTPNARLISSLTDYRAGLLKVREIRELCGRYMGDDQATRAFIEICVQAQTSLPSEPGAVDDLIQRLQRAGE
jgi:hypothetical protein